MAEAVANGVGEGSSHTLDIVAIPSIRNANLSFGLLLGGSLDAPLVSEVAHQYQELARYYAGGEIPELLFSDIAAFIALGVDLRDGTVIEDPEEYIMRNYPRSGENFVVNCLIGDYFTDYRAVVQNRMTDQQPLRRITFS